MCDEEAADDVDRGEDDGHVAMILASCGIALGHAAGQQQRADDVMPEIALEPDISGVCSVGGTLVMTSKPTKIASTKTVSSRIENQVHGPPPQPRSAACFGGGRAPESHPGPRATRGCTTSPSWVTSVPATISSSRSMFSAPSLTMLSRKVATFLAYIWLAWYGTVAGMLVGPRMVHAVFVHRLAGPGQLAVAAALGGEVDDHRARLHAAHHLGGDQHRGLLAGDGGGGDHHVRLGDDRGHHLALLL